ncbi:MAG: glucosyl transferase, partial [Calditrichaeota bacterium]|nr:glucosyl transferase [Calditrichota bacterium]
MPGYGKNILLWVLLIWMVWGCERLSLPVVGSGLTVKVEADAVLVTEVWLRLQVEPVPEDGVWQLWRGDSLMWQAAVTDSDTVAYDSGLLPNHTYTYQARLLQNGQMLARSNSLTLTTMDTTSHDFEWQVIEFPSPFGSGALYDVAIIDENNIWAVGEIYADSAQPWLPYNAVHWDGERWELMRIYKENNRAIKAIRGILTFDTQKFWFAAGSIYLWDKKACSSAKLVYRRDVSTFQTVEKLWGTSENNIYGVGNNGLIAHYDGVSWRRVESGTDLPIQDIWGDIDAETGEAVILCIASD